VSVENGDSEMRESDGKTLEVLGFGVLWLVERAIGRLAG